MSLKVLLTMAIVECLVIYFGKLVYEATNRDFDFWRVNNVAIYVVGITSLLLPITLAAIGVEIIWG